MDSLAIEVMVVSWNHDKFDGSTAVRELYILNSNPERDYDDSNKERDSLYFST